MLCKLVCKQWNLVAHQLPIERKFKRIKMFIKMCAKYNAYAQEYQYFQGPHVFSKRKIEELCREMPDYKLPKIVSYKAPWGSFVRRVETIDPINPSIGIGTFVTNGSIRDSEMNIMTGDTTYKFAILFIERLIDNYSEIRVVRELPKLQEVSTPALLLKSGRIYEDIEEEQIKKTYYVKCSDIIEGDESDFERIVY